MPEMTRISQVKRFSAMHRAVSPKQHDQIHKMSMLHLHLYLDYLGKGPLCFYLFITKHLFSIDYALGTMLRIVNTKGIYRAKIFVEK